MRPVALFQHGFAKDLAAAQGAGEVGLRMLAQSSSLKVRVGARLVIPGAVDENVDFTDSARAAVAQGDESSAILTFE